MTAAVLAAALTFAAVWALVPAGPVSLGRLGRTSSDRRRLSLARWLLVGGCALLAWQLLLAEGISAFVPGVGAAVAASVTQRLVAHRRRRRARNRRQAACVEMCDAFAAELEGGSPAGTALERACAPWSELAGVSAAARLGDDVGAALRRSARLPGAEGLRAVAAAWDVAARSGAALALVLTKVAGGLRSDEEARAEVAAELSSPRATAKLLAALPLFGIGLGLSVGAEPLRFLLHTTAGLVCLSAGVALALLGMWWVEHLSSAAEV